MNPLTKKLLALGASAVIAVSGGVLVGPFESEQTKAYQDIVGVWTICYGETQGVRPGMVKTPEQCQQSLATELTRYNQDMKKNVKVKLPEHAEVAYTSFVWNVGVGAWNGSTLLKYLNQGEYDEACAQLLRWDKAGGVVVKGLTNRRKAEYKACMGNDQITNESLAEVRRLVGASLDVSVEAAKENHTIQLQDKATVVPLAFGEPNDGGEHDRVHGAGGGGATPPVADYSCRFSLGTWCLWKVAGRSGG